MHKAAFVEHSEQLTFLDFVNDASEDDAGGRHTRQVSYPLRTAHYTEHTTHCTLHTTHYTLHTTNYTLRTTHYTLHTTHVNDASEVDAGGRHTRQVSWLVKNALTGG